MMAAGSERRSPWLRRLAPPLVCALLILGVGHLRFPLTRSLPRGLYLALPARTPFHSGDIVSFCIAPSLAHRLRDLRLVGPGRCPGNVLPLAKRVAAIAPRVCSREDGILIDQRFLPWPVFPSSVPLGRYRHCGPTPAGCLFVLGDSLDSIDSRTFGCVPQASILNRIIPLVTEPS